MAKGKQDDAGSCHCMLHALRWILAQTHFSRGGVIPFRRIKPYFPAIGDRRQFDSSFQREFLRSWDAAQICLKSPNRLEASLSDRHLDRKSTRLNSSHLGI